MNTLKISVLKYTVLSGALKVFFLTEQVPSRAVEYPSELMWLVTRREMASGLETYQKDFSIQVFNIEN